MTQEEKDNYLRRFHRFQQSREKHFAPIIRQALNQQYKTFTDNAKYTGVPQAIDMIDSGGVYKVLNNMYYDAGITYGAKIRSDLNRVKARMPMGFSERISELIRQYFGLDILNTSQGITETTKNIIREVFINGYEIGLGIDDLVKQLENTDLSRIRARTIARTESTGAANAGAMIVAKETGLKLNKEWLAANDHRTRHDHRNINGQVVAMDDFFNVGGYMMAQPGDKGGKEGQLPVPAKEVVNCRCTILHIPIREGGRLVRRV